MINIRDEQRIRQRIETHLARARTFEKVNDLPMALDLIHRADELMWALGELNDDYSEAKGE